MIRLSKLIPIRQVNTLSAYTLSNILISSISIVFGPFILKKAGLSDYGMLSLAIYVFSIFFAMTDFGLPAHLIAVHSKNSKDADREIASCFLMKILLLIGALLLFVVYLVLYPHEAAVKKLASVYFLAILFSTTHIEWLYISTNNIRTLIKGRLIVALTGYSLLLTWYFTLNDLRFIPAALGCAQLAGLIFLFLKSGFSPARHMLRLLSLSGAWKTLIRLTPIAGTHVLSFFFIQSGIHFMTRFFGHSEVVGAYSISHRLIAGILMLIVPLVLFFIPESARSRSRIPLVKVILYCGLLTLLFLAGGIVIIKIFYIISHPPGAEAYFWFSFNIFSILLIGIFFTLLRTVYVSEIISSGKYKAYFMVHLTGALPTLCAAFTPGLNLSSYEIALLVCTPEILTTSLFIILYYLRMKTALLHG